ncbi:hypothetical protein GHT06_001841 [Daphnia sinensis]|uniref:Uncharacterized protein n=1 Tax=Daphnia sinensis TaxID=1820382 RepID=A0AAD5KDE1_9CRUS|nr:hypothetical protein GHT06_001841 [Daphnia sinensis]
MEKGESKETFWYTAAIVLTLITVAVFAYNSYNYYLDNRDPTSLDQVVMREPKEIKSPEPLYILDARTGQESPLNKKAKLLIQCKAIARATSSTLIEYNNAGNQWSEVQTGTIVMSRTLEFFILSMYGGRIDNGVYNGDNINITVTNKGREMAEKFKQEYLSSKNTDDLYKCLTWMQSEAQKNKESMNVYRDSFDLAKRMTAGL